MSASPKGEDLAVVHCRGRARAIAVLHLAVADIVGLGPEDLAVDGIEAKNTFLFARGFLIVEGVDVATGDGDAGVTAADRLAPAWPDFLGELRRQFGFRPDAIAVGAAPLRPV